MPTNVLLQHGRDVFCSFAKFAALKSPVCCRAIPSWRSHTFLFRTLGNGFLHSLVLYAKFGPPRSSYLDQIRTSYPQTSHPPPSLTMSKNEEDGGPDKSLASPRTGVSAVNHASLDSAPVSAFAELTRTSEVSAEDFYNNNNFSLHALLVLCYGLMHDDGMPAIDLLACTRQRLLTGGTVH